MNNPITMSCNQVDLEKQIVLRAKRLIRVLACQMLSLDLLSVDFSNGVMLLVKQTQAPLPTRRCKSDSDQMDLTTA